jgi:hypothetical protein
VVRILISAALKIGSKRPSHVGRAAFVDIRQAGLPTIRSGKPSEHMVEGSVLHHEHDNSVKGGVGWRWKGAARLHSGSFIGRRGISLRDKAHYRSTARERENAATCKFPYHSSPPACLGWNFEDSLPRLEVSNELRRSPYWPTVLL